MKFIRTFRQHGIAGNIAEGIEIKTFVLGKEKKREEKSKENLCSAAFTIF